MKRKFTLIKTMLLALLVMAGSVSAWGQKWELTDISSLTSDDVFLIVNTASSHAMANDGGTKSAPAAVSVTLNAAKNEVVGSISENLKWNIEGSAGQYVFYPNGTTDTWLYLTDTNNGVRVGTNKAKTFSYDNYNGTVYKLKHNGTNRYVGVYEVNPDWRCYTAADQGNIAKTDTKFFKYVSSNSNPTVAVPSFDPASGNFSEAFDLTIETATEGATIYYTLDGNDPTTSSTQYTAAININGTDDVTVKAFAVKDGMDDSAVATATYTYVEPIETVDYDFVEDFEGDYVVLLSNNQYEDGSFTNNGVTWKYGHSRDQENFPINGKGLMLRRASDSYLEATFPNGVGDFGFFYRKAFTGSKARQLEIIVNGTQVATTEEFGTSSVAEDDIYYFNHEVNEEGPVTIRIKNVGTATDNRQTTIDNIGWTNYGEPGNPKVARPSITPAAKEFTDPFEVTISTATEDATIYYTTDGTENWITYTDAFEIDATEDVTVKAYATKEGMEDSEVAEVTYTYVAPIETVGDGSEEKPYTVSDVILLNNSIAGAGKQWVKGYIVGAANSMSKLELKQPFTVATNILLAESPDETDAAKMVPVQLPTGAVRTALNLVDKPANLAKHISVYGTLEAYFGQAGVKNVTDYKLDFPTNVNSIQAIDHLYSTNGNIHFQAVAGETVEVYNVAGQKLATRIATEGLNTLPVNVQGVVIVKVGNKVGKTIIR